MELDLFQYRAWLTASDDKHPVYDGDTVRLTVDLGFGISKDLGPCRLFGINAPEMRGDEREQGTITRDWLRERLDGEGEFSVRTYKDEKGKFGRYLVLIILDDGTNVNDELVAEGLAEHRVY